MKIESKAKRPAGTTINLFGLEFHFKPEDASLKPGTPEYAAAPHVCEIGDDSVIHRLCVGIKEGFAPLDRNAVIPQPSRSVPTQSIINSATGQPIEPVKPVIIECDGEQINLTTIEPEALRALAKGTFGINVHHKWNDATVIAKIVEKTRGTD